MSHRGELLELLTRCVRDGAVRLMLQRAEAECMLVAPGLAARLRDVDAAAAKGTLAQLDTVIETAAAERTLSTLLEDRAKQAAAAPSTYSYSKFRMSVLEYRYSDNRPYSSTKY